MAGLKIEVTASALRDLLGAFNGPSYLVRELQAIRSLGNSPIDTLCNEYNAGVKAHNASVKVEKETP